MTAPLRVTHARAQIRPTRPLCALSLRLILMPLCALSVVAVAPACDGDAGGEGGGRVPVIDLTAAAQAGAAAGEVSGGAGGGGPAPVSCERPFTLRAAGQSLGDVRLAGSFESPPWSGAIALTEEAPGEWVARVSLPEGRHRYKLIIDGQWSRDLDQLEAEADGLGGLNSALTHACPLEPECVLSAECAAEAPFCRGLSCVSEDLPRACEVCAPDERCDPLTAACLTPPPPQCDESRPCAAPLVCEAGACVAECESDADCEARGGAQGDRCVSLECVTPECEPSEGGGLEGGDGVAEGCDALEQSCVAYRCAPRLCAEQLFVLDPRDPALAPALGAGEVVAAHVAGEFNGWAPTVAEGGWSMSPAPDGRLFTRRRLDDGRYAYKLVLTVREGGGERAVWVADPLEPQRVNDGFNGENSVREVSCGAGGVCGDPAEFVWESAVMYFVMVDRFYDSDGRAQPVEGATGGDAARGASGQYEGGDLAGVTAKLPYLRDLGVSAVWLSAPYENRDAAGRAIDPNADPRLYSAYHGYWPSPANIDYSDPLNPSPTPAVESRIGTSDDLDALVSAAHDGGTRVLFDYVMNHVDINSGLYAAHPEWFARKQDGSIAVCGPENLWDDPYWGLRCAFTDYLPPFDFDNAEARAWSVRDALWWAWRYQIDGYRLDAIKHVPQSWLLDLRAGLNELFTEPDGGRFYLVGETFAYDNRDLLRSFVDPATKLDGQFDFPYKARLCEALFRPEGRLDSFSGWLQENEGFYGARALMTTWIGNHDIPRPIHFASGQIPDCRGGSNPGNGWTPDYSQPTDAAPYERLGLAFGVMFTNPGVPLLYYGDEVGLAGGGDPDNRRMMPWEDSALNAHQVALRERVSRLGAARARYRALSRGRRVTLSADQSVWVYRLVGCGGAEEEVTVALNKADTPSVAQVPAGSYTDLLTGEPMSGGALTLPPRTLRALVVSP